MSVETNIRRLVYRIKYHYPTREVVTVCLVALAVVWFIWGSVQAMQKNYELRRVVDAKERQAQLTELEMRTLEYEQRYLQSEEYKKLAVRQRLGHGDPGEKVLILPANTEEASNAGSGGGSQSPAMSREPSNMGQWINFLFGGNVRE